ncbi:MAG: GNAT family N-acetyltransferase [Synergistaceae bacterium]|nr:GNAT family N-acetyltransferase [Synergistaceae bacterium]
MYRLRELERRDLAEINKWRNDPELINLLGAPFRYINYDVDVQWFENYMKSRSNAVRCAIVKDDDNIIGLVSLVPVDVLNQSAEFHIMIGSKENQNKGCGTFAINEILKHAFMNMNLHRVELGVLENNTRARHLYEKAGFIQEGIMRGALFKNGKFVNKVMYSILREEYCIKYLQGGG